VGNFLPIDLADADGVKLKSAWNGDTLTEEYLFPVSLNKKDAGIVDSIILYYSKQMNDITEFSLSHKMDSARKTKLFKVRVIGREQMPDGFSVTLPQQEMSSEIFKADITTDERMIPFFEKFIKWYEEKRE
jgi:hypothetical protein